MSSSQLEPDQRTQHTDTGDYQLPAGIPDQVDMNGIVGDGINENQEGAPISSDVLHTLPSLTPMSLEEEMLNAPEVISITPVRHSTTMVQMQEQFKV
jgi:hypothetical protein